LWPLRLLCAFVLNCIFNTEHTKNLTKVTKEYMNQSFYVKTETRVR
jgi:hypothetical protein